MRKFYFNTMVMIVALLVMGIPAQGEAKNKEKEKIDLATTGRVSIEQAIKTAMKQMAGTVIEAELEAKQGKTVWEIEIVSEQGELRKLYIDAESGSIVEVQEKKKHKKGKHHKHKHLRKKKEFKDKEDSRKRGEEEKEVQATAGKMQQAISGKDTPFLAGEDNIFAGKRLDTHFPVPLGLLVFHEGETHE